MAPTTQPLETHSMEAVTLVPALSSSHIQLAAKSRYTSPGQRSPGLLDADTWKGNPHDLACSHVALKGPNTDLGSQVILVAPSLSPFIMTVPSSEWLSFPSTSLCGS